MAIRVLGYTLQDAVIVPLVWELFSYHFTFNDKKTQARVIAMTNSHQSDTTMFDGFVTLLVYVSFYEYILNAVLVFFFFVNEGGWGFHIILALFLGLR